ncbi:OLC1v1004870C1 [Oldenlandia corymbosa var. corymbosa]|uniref:OLC1v1004870C1 n=1 Tax=Oldenlandia corymbosa var. corymbosa TaxID=529605 RepID=A0AAV1DG10_OLDCO|nr:OLC1v1004870C1 [Oldenlandia corymbosa var. corymbosa]
MAGRKKKGKAPQPQVEERNQSIKELARFGDELQDSSVNSKEAVKEISNLTTPAEVKGSHMRQSPSVGHSSGKRQDEIELLGRDLTAKRQLQWSEMIEREEKQGVWAKNDTSKFKAPSGKLQFIPPKEVAGQNIVQMQMEDVKTKAEYWESSIACFVLGAHPPIGVMERYFQKLWGNLGIDKPLIVKASDVEKGINYNDVEYVPIWICLYGLEVKFWNLNSLSRLVSAIGTPILADDYTVRKERVQFARILVEMKIAANVPDKLVFEDEKGNVKDEGRSNAAKTIATDDNQRNPILRRKDQSPGGKPVVLQDFECGLRDLTQKGKMFTWCNQRVGTKRIYAKLDRALVNWINQYADSIATLLMEGVSDHSPPEVQFKVEMQKRSAFRFFNMWCLSTEFHRTVERSWAENVEGTYIVEKANREEMQLEVLQQNLSLDPGDVDLQKRKKILLAWRRRGNGGDGAAKTAVEVVNTENIEVNEADAASVGSGGGGSDGRREGTMEISRTENSEELRSSSSDDDLVEAEGHNNGGDHGGRDHVDGMETKKKRNTTDNLSEK